MATPIRSTSLPDQLFDRLLSDIVEGRYAAGDRLPSQRTLAAEYGVNMASLRAAIDRLAQLAGPQIDGIAWRTTGGLEVVAHAAMSEPTLIAAVFEARALLLREAASLAAERADDASRKEIMRLAEAFAAATAGQERQALDLAFMGAVIEAAGNLVFTLIFNSMRAGYLARGGDFQAMVSADANLDAHYVKVARAIAAGKPAQAGRAMDSLTTAQLTALIAGEG
ncbi:MAG TPA: GntR family transcriptional regulator [Baekduia sp.]|nr:GntR family transcriptional regulator [Baekduia sp.]